MKFIYRALKVIEKNLEIPKEKIEYMASFLEINQENKKEYKTTQNFFKKRALSYSGFSRNKSKNTCKEVKFS